MVRLSLRVLNTLPYEEIKVLFGVKHGNEKSEVELIDTLNDLAVKGWLSKTENGYWGHSVIMDIIRQKQKPTYLHFLFLIPNITKKLENFLENKSPEILKYLSHGQSVLDNLQEENQPLFLLANNLFEGYRQIGLWKHAFNSRINNLEWARRNYSTDISRYAHLNFGVYLGNLSLSYKNMYQIERDIELMKIALKYQLEAVEIFESIPLSSSVEINERASGYDVLSHYYVELGHIELAMNTVLKSLDFKEGYEEIISNQSIAASLHILGNIQNESGEYLKAEKLMRKAMSILANDENNHDSKMVKIHHSLSRVYWSLEKFVEAEKYQLNGIRIFEKNGFLMDMDFASYLENAGDISIKLGKLKIGTIFYQRALKAYSQLFGARNEHTQRMQLLLSAIKDITE